MTRVWDIPVDDSTRVRDVRVAAETAGHLAGLDPHRIAVAALVATELATNLLRHAGGGRMVINLVDRARPHERTPAVQLTALDHGPGIGDVGAATRDGYTTSDASLGAGLGTCLRISNAFDLHSTPRGTVAVARVDRAPGREAIGPSCRAGGINVPLAQAGHSGDAWTWTRSGARLTLMLADGLGHGAEAGHASGAAVDALHRAAHLPPEEILRQMHPVLRPTRGAAVAVAQLDTDRAQLAFAGVGNIGARLYTARSWEHLVSHPGIVGARFPARVPVRHRPWRAGSLLVLHSDGLPSRWVPPDDRVLLSHDPAVVAATVLRDASSPASPVRDDTSVAVLAAPDLADPRL
ncbi:SpoIIE family protein phosphatase [Streptomyces sp. NRRL S-340]|uniref:SpoIIE family protein phosphatase n=1 Tax=Streptomyces sp. NRRL S-340 TaxID=1463901 RepID=UPI0005663B49|nr:SpoIIE family protein phosphatase [Streptomyces sp. NRRL S-340]